MKIKIRSVPPFRFTAAVWRRWLIVLLALALPLSSSGAFFIVTNSDNTVTIYVGGLNSADLAGDVSIPDSTNGYPITRIGDWGFEDCYNMTSVTIPGSVTSIGDYSFYACSGLTNVSLTNGVTSIGEAAFSACWSLTSLAIPDSVTNIGGELLVASESLTNISVGAGNLNYTSVGGVLFDKTLTTLIQYPDGITNESYFIPGSVTCFGSGAFESAWNLKNVTLPNGLTGIAYAVFEDCANLESVTIPDSVRSIDISAFEGCNRLASVTIPDSVTSIGDEAFGASGMTLLTNVVIGTGVTNLGIYAFQYCINLHQVYFQGNAPSVDGADGSTDNTVFSGESGTVYYQPGTTGWGPTFGGWPTASEFTYTSTNGCTTISGYSGPGGIVAIPRATDGGPVTAIGAKAFCNKTAVTSVTVPESVTDIGPAAFQSCASLHQMYFRGNAPSVDGGAGDLDNTVFSGESGIVYYLPGTTGWSGTFGGWPTAVWQPQLQIAGNASAANRGGFGFNINWASGQSVVVETSSNLQDWTAVSTNTLVNGVNTFGDSTSTNDPERFYRVRTP